MTDASALLLASVRQDTEAACVHFESVLASLRLLARDASLAPLERQEIADALTLLAGSLSAAGKFCEKIGPLMPLERKQAC